MSQILTTIGLMSGTSGDGVDAAIIRTDGINILPTGQYHYIPYNMKLRHKILNCQTIPEMLELEDEITKIHGQVVNELLAKYNLKSEQIDLIGFHGQTIHHDPIKGLTLQIGNSPLLSTLTGIKVVSDFRRTDLANGGQGAPLAPIYHQALLAKHKDPVAIINIGGISNITYIKDSSIIAFDMGPGNCLIDDFIQARTGQTCDKNGEIAARGVISKDIIYNYTSLDYFQLPFPKSLDRGHFTLQNVENLSLEDGAATLTALTCESITMGLELLPSQPAIIYICGGGANNGFLMKLLGARLNCKVAKLDELGFNGDFIEAECFGYLAARVQLGLETARPELTGAKKATSGGGIWKI